MYNFVSNGGSFSSVQVNIMSKSVWCLDTRIPSTEYRKQTYSTLRICGTLFDNLFLQSNVVYNFAILQPYSAL